MNRWQWNFPWNSRKKLGLFSVPLETSLKMVEETIILSPLKTGWCFFSQLPTRKGIPFIASPFHIETTFGWWPDCIPISSKYVLLSICFPPSVSILAQERSKRLTVVGEWAGKMQKKNFWCHNFREKKNGGERNIQPAQPRGSQGSTNCSQQPLACGAASGTIHAIEVSSPKSSRFGWIWKFPWDFTH